MTATPLQTLERLGAAGRFEAMQAHAQTLLAAGSDARTLLRLGAIQARFGFLEAARACYEAAGADLPGDLRPALGIANLAHEAGDTAEAQRRYAALLEQAPDDPVVRRNALTCMEYYPDSTAGDRLMQARRWGEWAERRQGGARPRPPVPPLAGRPLRIGYVSADFCQHTVGLFVQGVLAMHDPRRVQVFAYHAGAVEDAVTRGIRAACAVSDVAHLDDRALAQAIRDDAIDVLVDLSGHTAGSRLTAFAQRPAPVMVSWLGYFATTGLACIDAVLLDPWHAPPTADAVFVENILRLETGRLCYQPLPWAPLPAGGPPCLQRSAFTFGCFNNTAKLNPAVFDVWARVLAAVPDARLLLKWRTFNDVALRRTVTRSFVERGIAAERIELRGPSFHADLLGEYADVDVALDPFPFSGGMTSCEALWMGVPVITWPQDRVVSRQTAAILQQSGLTEGIARSADDYVQKAVEAAADRVRLAALRQNLRTQLRASPLMDLRGFTRGLETALIDLYRSIEAGAG